jgi:hypothetical protein
MTDCRTCIHRRIPIVFNVEHPCLGCHGERVVIGGSNYEAEPDSADPLLIRAICSVFEDGK